MKTMIHAHRGASGLYPENTMEAFSAAIMQGTDCIELDVHLTKDGHVVVAHDARLERVSNGSGYINDHTLEELKSLDFSRLFPGSPVCRIPELSEVFTLVKSSRLTLNIELKSTERLYPELPEKLNTMAGDYGLEERVIYSSFNHYSLQAIKKLNAAAKIGLLYELAMVDPWVYADYVGADAVHPHYFVVAALPETVTRCHEKGIQVNVWTVDDPQAVKLMLKCGVDGIITNKPDIAVACRNELI
ncbi:MAG: glycerophosphodiester phosphodiesterase [Treponema sp.]|nr:glycerophosphodiester phosphodiesterase [Treponema sp.]